MVDLQLLTECAERVPQALGAMQHVSARLKLRAALVAGVSPRSVDNYLGGASQYETTLERISGAFVELGHPELVRAADPQHANGQPTTASRSASPNATPDETHCNPTP